MALQKEITLASGIVCPAAYSRISSITHTHTEVIVNVQTWADAAARTDLKQVIADRPYSLPWSDGVSLTSAYTALKETPDFVGAFDV